MHDESQVAIANEDDSLTDASQGSYPLTVERGDWRIERAYHERTAHSNAYQDLANDARFKCREIRKYVGKFGHCVDSKRGACGKSIVG